MALLLKFAGSLLAALIAAYLLHPVMELRPRLRVVPALLLLTAVLLSPLIVPTSEVMTRFLSAVLCLMIAGKMYDVLSAPRAKDRLTARRYLSFLLNPFALVERTLDSEPRPSRATNLRRLGLGAAIVIPVDLLLWWIYRSAPDWPFVLEHCAKTVFTMTGIFGGAVALTALWRLAGLPGRDVMRNFFIAPTPAEFWRRYNRLAGQLLFEDVYRPLRRRIGSFGAVMVTFACSGVVHEYVFGIATGRVHGYQLGFFLLQGIAVGVTQLVRPRGGSAIIWLLTTWLFMVASSALFFASWNLLGQHYSSAAPAWMSPEP